MSDRSSIEWTDATWNPVTGCDKVSPGCDNCYAETFAERWRGIAGHHYEQGFDLRLWPSRLDQPATWRKPRRVFVNSMSDLFHPGVPDAFIGDVLAVIEATPQHQYQLLTKRPGRMASVLRKLQPQPLPNLWLGTSIEDDHFAWRADFLRKTPAAVRFLSCEPLIGPVPNLSFEAIDWVIIGGESGPGARPMKWVWARDIRSRAQAAGSAVFVKQSGTVLARAKGSAGKGNDPQFWPRDMRIRAFPGV